MKTKLPKSIKSLKNEIVKRAKNYMKRKKVKFKFDVHSYETTLKENLNHILLPSAWDSKLHLIDYFKSMLNSTSAMSFEYVLKNIENQKNINIKNSKKFSNEFHKVIELFMGNYIKKNISQKEVLTAMSSAMIQMNNTLFYPYIEYTSAKEHQEMIKEIGYKEKDAEYLGELLGNYAIRIFSLPNSKEENYKLVYKYTKNLVLKINKLQLKCNQILIETMEREDICSFIDQVIIEKGFDIEKIVEKYGDGNEITEKWREW